MRLLFDHNVPAPLRRLLIRHEISLAAELGWHEMVNRELLAAAERAGFDLLLTADQNIRFSVFDRSRPNRVVGIARATSEKRTPCSSLITG